MKPSAWTLFPTVEVRWFLRGEVPPEVQHWFGGESGRLPIASSRTDYYLRLPESPGLGIKLREGRVEVKQRQAAPDVARLHGRVSGLVAAWHKWSFDLASGEDAPAGSVIPPGWTPVEKVRWLRRYQYTGAGSIREMPASILPSRGCDWELACVRVAGETWWTTAFESFGHESSLHARLFAVTGEVLASGVPPVLRTADSKSYPSWLASLVGPSQGGLATVGGQAVGRPIL